MKLDNHLSRKFPLAKRLMRGLIFAVTIIFFFGAIIVPFEIDDPNTKIHNLFDGVWWATTTVSTVGYGDIVPVTFGGRIIGILLQLTGAMIFFGALVGTITVYLHHLQDEYRWKRLQDKLERIEDDSREIKSKLDFMLKNKSSSPQKPRQWGL